MKNQKEQSREFAILAARAADEKKAENVRLIDVGLYSPITDYVLLITASSTPQINAIDDDVEFKLKQAGSLKLHGDGAKTDMWRVADYGGFIVHILNEESREFYALDKLFSVGADVAWEPAKTKKTAAPKATAKEKTPKAAKTKTAKPKAVKKTVKAKTVKAAAPKAKAAKKPAAKTKAVKAKKTTKK